MSTAISLPFSFDETGSIATTSDLAKIWEDRVMLTVMTGLGDRAMRPTFGSDVNQVVWENINDAFVLAKQSISVAFSRWLTSLNLVNVSGYVDPIDSYLVVQVKYVVRAQNITTTLNIKTAILSRSGDVLLEVASNG